jgi:hypothetical protein
MSSAATLAISTKAGTGAGLCAALRGAFKRLSWRVLGATLAIVVALIAWSVFDKAFAAGPAQLATDHYISATIVSLLIALSMIFTTLVADELVAAGARRVLTYALAVVIGSAVGALAQWEVHNLLNLSPTAPGGGIPGDAVMTQAAFVFSECLIWGSIIVFLYVNRRSALRAAARLNSAQLLLAATQRRTLEARLQALQAHIEPQFLFNSLAQVRDLYDSDPEKGGQVLGDLIIYLRAALPRLREPVSTLQQELDLAVAYLKVICARFGGPFDLVVDVSDMTSAARMPAMVLLPLVNHLLANEAGPRGSSDAIRFVARRVDAKLHLVISHGGRHFATGCNTIDLRDVEQRLEALYGDEWKLAIGPSGNHGVQAVMEIPYESAEGSHC